MTNDINVYTIEPWQSARTAGRTENGCDTASARIRSLEVQVEKLTAYLLQQAEVIKALQIQTQAQIPAVGGTKKKG